MAELRQFDQSLPMLLLRAREAALGYFRPLLKQFGLTEQQWRVLRVLNESTALNAATLADRTALLPPSLTRMVRTLAERGLVQHDRSEADGRERRLSLTAAGAALVAEIAPLSEAQYARMAERLSPARFEALTALLADFAALENGHG